MKEQKHLVRTLLSQLPFERFRNPPPVVGVVRLNGVIGRFGTMREGLTLASLERTLERTFGLFNLKAVAIVINSPGGSAAQSSLIANRIRTLAAEKEIKVTAFAEDLAASGGYWLACAGDEIYADDNSIVGSIGVIHSNFGFPELLERLGIERRLHTSGKNKAMLDPFSPEKKEDVKHLKKVQGVIHENFKNWVRERRGGKLKAKEEEAFSGAWWSGGLAVEMGLIDGIGNLHDLMHERHGEDVRLISVQVGKPFWRRFFPGGGGGSELSSEWAASALSVAEERFMWSRFGL
jgi:signal peptide peptidase SppA